MQDLKDVTQDVHYENFRAQCISQISQHAMRERGYVKFVFFYLTLLHTKTTSEPENWVFIIEIKKSISSINTNASIINIAFFVHTHSNVNKIHYYSKK